MHKYIHFANCKLVDVFCSGIFVFVVSIETEFNKMAAKKKKKMKEKKRKENRENRL